jgi:hypothetical protein
MKTAKDQIVLTDKGFEGVEISSTEAEELDKSLIDLDLDIGFLEQDNDVISVNEPSNPRIDIVGARKEGDKKLVSYVDLGAIDNARTKQVNAALAYVSGKPGRFADVKQGTISKGKVLAFVSAAVLLSIAATMFAIQI